MLVIDEYVAVDVVLGDWPAGLPDDDTLLLPASRHFRLLQRIHNPGGGQLSAVLDRLPEPDRHAMRHPHPEVVQILDPRPLLDEAASIGARYRTGGLLIVETLAAGLTFGHQLWFGTERNIGGRLTDIAADLGIAFTSPGTPESLPERCCNGMAPCGGLECARPCVGRTTRRCCRTSTPTSGACSHATMWFGTVRTTCHPRPRRELHDRHLRGLEHAGRHGPAVDLPGPGGRSVAHPPGAYVIAGHDDAIAVAEIADIDSDGVVHVRQVPGPVSANDYLLSAPVS